MFANDAQAGLAQPPAHLAGPGHGLDMRYGLRVVGAGIGPVVVQPAQLQRVPGQVDAAQRIQPQSLACARFGRGPKQQGNVGRFGQPHGKGAIGKGRLESDQQVERFAG